MSIGAFAAGFLVGMPVGILLGLAQRRSHRKAEITVVVGGQKLASEVVRLTPSVLNRMGLSS